jgi:ubiquinone/menaquinone biosynthesis C-methylase UbiE
MTTTLTSHHPYGETYGGSATENYERFFVPAIGGPFAADLIAQAAVKPGERVLDVACGTGALTRLAAEHVGPQGSVAGLDVNPGMLAVARSLPAPADPRISWYEAPAESMPLPDDAFDVVLCQLGLQFMDDKPAAVREMHRVTAAGGPAGFDDVTVRSHEKEITLPSPREFLWQYIQSTPLSVLVAEAGGDVVAALERDVVTGWQPWVGGGGMSNRQGVIVTTARK